MNPQFRTATFRGLTIALLLLAGAPAHAAEVDELRAQMEAMKAEYQARMQALEQRLAQLEAQAAAAPAVPAQVAAAPAVAEAPASTGMAGGGNSANAFNPAISVILGGRYTQTSADPATYRHRRLHSGGRCRRSRRSQLQPR